MRLFSRAGLRSAPVRVAFSILVFLSATLPANASSSPCADKSSDNFPVIVYDANARSAILVPRQEATNVMRTAPDHYVYQSLPDIVRSPFLCDGKPVEIYIFNRRLETAYTVSLTSLFNVPASTIDLRGATSAAATAAPAAPPTPAAKGFAPIPTGGNLLTTDQVIGYFLNDETYEKPLTKFADDVSTIFAQAKQLEINVTQYEFFLQQVSGGSADGVFETPIGGSSLASLSASWTALGVDVAAPRSIVSEAAFGDWANRADRLQTEASRINAKIQAYPIVDSLINLKASAAVLKDNLRGVRSERDSIASAIDILKGLYGTEYGHPQRDYLTERRKAELRIALRTHYGSAGTISEATLARIVDALNSATTRPKALDISCRVSAEQSGNVSRYCDARNKIDETPRESPDETGQDTTNAPPQDTTNVTPQDTTNMTPQDTTNVTPQDTTSMTVVLARRRSMESSSLTKLVEEIDDKIASAETALIFLRRDIAMANRAEGDTLRAINVVYDIYRAPVLTLNLDLQGNSGNLFVYYTVTKAEQFNRYQIIYDMAQPLSNCALAITANTNAAGGFNPCTTPATTTPPAPTATYSTSQFPPSQSPTGAPAPAASATPAASVTPTTPAPATATGYADYYGHFERHHFSHGTLITGIAYDSVANNSFSWVACSTSASYPAGNLPSGTTGTCISPSVTTSNPTPPTYYQLVKSSQAPVAAVEGVDLFLLNRGRAQDMFPGHQKLTPGLFLGAAAYPLNHYFVGTTIEPERGFNISAGAVFGSQTILPSSFAYTPGSYASVNPSIPTSTKFKTGFFIMIGFDTSLFGQIFNGSIFQSVLSIGTAGSPPTPAPTTTPAAPAPTQ